MRSGKHARDVLLNNGWQLNTACVAAFFFLCGVYMDALRSPRCAGKFSGTGVLSMTVSTPRYLCVWQITLGCETAHAQVTKRRGK